MPNQKPAQTAYGSLEDRSRDHLVTRLQAAEVRLHEMEAELARLRKTHPAADADRGGARRPRPESTAFGDLDSLRESEERLAALLNQLPVGVGMFDLRGRWIFENPFLHRLVPDGFPSRDPGRADRWHIASDDGSPVKRTQWPGSRALLGETVNPGTDFLYGRPDETPIWLRVGAVPFRDPAGEVVGAIMVVEDTTGRREAEKALLEAKDAAERASRVKSKFLSTMSHELRTPLNAVIGLAELLESEVVGPTNHRQKEHLARIGASAWHLVNIIDEILTFTRSEAGKEEVRLSDVDVADIVREVAGILETRSRVEGLALRLRGAEDGVVMRTDAGKVRQILVNLVGNALKYTDEGCVEVELAEQGDGIELRVRDTGPGIPPESQVEIFEPFFQLDQSRTRTHGGTGLGLTISRRQARLLGGEVTVESEPGRGSTFILRLPRR